MNLRDPEIAGVAAIISATIAFVSACINIFVTQSNENRRKKAERDLLLLQFFRVKLEEMGNRLQVLDASYGQACNTIARTSPFSEATLTEQSNIVLTTHNALLSWVNLYFPILYSTANAFAVAHANHFQEVIKNSRMGVFNPQDNEIVRLNGLMRVSLQALYTKIREEAEVVNSTGSPSKPVEGNRDSSTLQAPSSDTAPAPPRR